MRQLNTGDKIMEQKYKKNLSAKKKTHFRTGHPAMIGDFDSPKLWLYL
jgi:hypothetical protein